MTRVLIALLGAMPVTAVSATTGHVARTARVSRRALSSVRMAQRPTPVELDPRRWAGRFAEASDARSVEITAVPKSAWTSWLAEQSETTRGWLEALGRSKFKPGEWTPIPAEDGVALGRVVLPVANASALFTYSALPGALPAGNVYALNVIGGLDERGANAAALSWALGAYTFDCLKKPSKPPETPEPRLVWPAGCDSAAVSRAAEATYLVRDLISAPCEQLGPAELEEATRALAARHEGAEVASTVGDALLSANLPTIHAVGRAAAAGREPRLIELRWRGADGPSVPRIAIIGKGVCFDTGGLDIKPAAAMLTMKKDMGGAAHALGLAHMVMDARLPVQLQLLLPAVENAISGSAFRPGDVLLARNGKTTEVGNTDAEGRLVLSDALVLAGEESPELIIDMATLTGASRVALGADVPSIFSNDDGAARELQDLSAAEQDQLWQLPLWEPYRKQLKSAVADLKNIGSGPYGGAITAALYLSEFVGRRGKAVAEPAEGSAGGDSDAGSDDGADASGAGGRAADEPLWLHMDVMAFNTASAPGRPEGGEAMGMRAFFAMLHKRYASRQG